MQKVSFVDIRKKTWVTYFSSFLICFVILLVYQFYINQNVFYGEPDRYYDLSKSFFGENNKFSFLNYPRHFRGYFFPLMFFPFRFFQLVTNEVINEIIVYRIYFSLLYAFVFGNLIPAIFTKLFNKDVSLLKRIILVILMLYFWGGFFIHPYTEISMITLTVIMIYFFSYMINENNIWKIFLYGLLTGIFVYGIYNIRTINIIYFLIFPIIFLIYGKGRPFKVNAIGAFACLLGFAISFYPQLIINNNNYQYPTPLVYAGDTPNGLFVPQLYRGINFIRWQAYLGEVQDYPNGMSEGIRFYDEVGSVIWNNVRGKISIKTYMILVSQYPLDFMRIYFQHFVAALDLRWNTDYVYDVTNPHNIFALLNFTLLYFTFFFARQIFQFSSNLFSKTNIYYLFLIPPALASLPAPTESRYYITMYLCIYVFLVYNANWQNIISRIVKDPINYLLKYVAFLVVMFSLSGMILGTLNDSPMLLSAPSDFSIYFELLLNRVVK